MREKGNDELSALMDGEATELEMHRVLRHIDEDPEQAVKWQRYHLVSAILKKEVRPCNAQHLATLDLASRVSAALAEEPVLHQASPAAHHEAPRAPTAPQAWWRPLANVAIAASVATVVVIGWQQNQSATSSPSGTSATPAVAQSNPSSISGVMPVAGAMPVAASANAMQYTNQQYANQQYANQQYANQQPYGSAQSIMPTYGVMPRGVAVPIEYVRTQKLDEQRFNRYLISHSGNAAFATQGGQLPYVRVVTLKPSDAVQH